MKSKKLLTLKQNLGLQVITILKETLQSPTISNEDIYSSIVETLYLDFGEFCCLYAWENIMLELSLKDDDRERVFTFAYTKDLQSKKFYATLVVKAHKQLTKKYVYLGCDVVDADTLFAYVFASKAIPPNSPDWNTQLTKFMEVLDVYDQHLEHSVQD